MTNLFSSFQTIQQRAEKASQQQQQMASSVPLMSIFWSTKPNGEKDRVLRLLHEGCITVPHHEMVKTVKGKVTDAVCLSSPIIDNHGKCPLCAEGYTVADRGVGLAVVREEKIEGDGPQRRAIIRDKFIDLNDRDSNQTKSVLYIGIIKQAIGNFWNSLAPVALRYGNVTSRDLQVSRVGSGTSTTYSFLPLDVDPELDSLEKVLSRYHDAMGGLSAQDLILQKINQKSSEGYYKRNFGADIFVSIGGAQSNGPSPQLQTVHDDNGSSDAGFADLRSKLQSYSADNGGGYSDDPGF